MKVYSTLLVTFFMISMINCQKVYKITTRFEDNTVIIEAQQVGDNVMTGLSYTLLSMSLKTFEDCNYFDDFSDRYCKDQADLWKKEGKVDHQYLTFATYNPTDQDYISSCPLPIGENNPFWGTVKQEITYPHLKIILVDSLDGHLKVNNKRNIGFLNMNDEDKTITIDKVDKLTVEIFQKDVNIKRKMWIPPKKDQDDNLKHRMIV